MHPRTRTLLETWFNGLNAGDTNQLLPLFSASPVIRNAANPTLEGPSAAGTLLSVFFERTRAREFTMIDAAQTGGLVFAAWTAVLTFRAGILIDGIRLGKDLTVPLRGIERFKLDELGRIAELDIIHETTTVPKAARSREAALEATRA